MAPPSPIACLRLDLLTPSQLGLQAAILVYRPKCYRGPLERPGPFGPKTDVDEAFHGRCSDGDDGLRRVAPESITEGEKVY
jgi:hypothetical protein